jgi:uncharacterized protein (TIGR02599 family)
MDADFQRPAPPRQAGFTLVEVLVASLLVLILIGLVTQLTIQTSRAWQRGLGDIQTFQEARAAYESLARTLGQAALNPYYDYYQGTTPRGQLPASDLAGFAPTSYGRASDLHFISGQAGTLLAGSPQPVITQTHAVFFQAPTGYSVSYRSLDNALNSWGYFIHYGDGAETVPPHLRNTPGYRPRYRFRLMEMRQPTEELGAYQKAGVSTVGWFVDHARTQSRVLAENVIALVLLPTLPESADSPAHAGQGVSLAPNYNYNSRVPLGAVGDPAFPGASPVFPPDAYTAYPVDGGSIAATRHHQLPPLLRVTMVVLDDQSFARLQKASGDSDTPPAALDLRGAGLFQEARRLADDLAALEAICQARPGNATGNTIPLNYQVFSTDVLLKEAKWSQ